MAQQGIIENFLRLPVTPVSQGLYEKIAKYLKTV
jgi:4-hydroxy-tetrahydrodipicolinate synthase